MSIKFAEIQFLGALLCANVILSVCVQIMELLVNAGIRPAQQGLAPPISFEELCLNTDPTSKQITNAV